MTPLEQHLKRRIESEGPVNVADYMAMALTHPENGYYTSRNAIGASGDFVTAPEVSQMFGELLGLWCAVIWQAMGQPERINLVELGPGRGTLMSDALRAANAIPGFADAIDIHLVEISPVFRKFQERALEEAATARQPTWHFDMGTVPEGPLLLIANEFIDALPIRQFKRTEEGWCEILVDLAGEGEGFQFAPVSARTVASVDPRSPEEQRTRQCG